MSLWQPYYFRRVLVQFPKTATIEKGKHTKASRATVAFEWLHAGWPDHVTAH